MEHIRYTFAEGHGTASQEREFLPKGDWITAAEFAQLYHVSRSSAYEAFKRLNTIRIGGCLRARRSEIEDQLARYGRI